MTPADMAPLVSIIIPTYNRAAFLGEALDSVLTQDVQDIECIVVDDGSTDGTPELVRGYQEGDRRIRYMQQSNRGPSAARNLGLNAASGRFIQFLDSDDIILSGKLLKQIALLESTSAPALSFCDYRYGSRDDINLPATRDKLSPPRLTMKRALWDIASRWETSLSIPIHCFLFDARFFTEEQIRFDENLRNHEDWDCWLRIFALDPTVYHVPEIMAVYRLHDDSICVDHAKLALGYQAAIRKQLRLFRHDPEMRRLLTAKLQEVNARFERSTNAKVQAGIVALGRMYRQSVPWPIQKLVASLRRLR